ncbi:MAG: ATP-dependent DNA helicase RecG [Candidatus Marinimicrobia bacterium]|nr:ATP-dependent DNA helicase RecG [Candidatus Neomarinimicrobiota bacterium]MBL7022602.1 ATP-dependent DNA helicase RecG [Candidatus Neomarinimicrobiota bacterium]MBL7109863.1 ATP-dependent DNA helicase RecG [Candidatus Neomarinimicrobiota bacterium]
MDTPQSFYQTNLETDITYLKGVGPKRAEALQKSGIETIADLLHHYPRRYLDRTTIKSIAELRVGDEAVIIGKVSAFGYRKTRKRNFFQMVLSDSTGNLQCVWFNGISWISDKFTVGDHIAVFGKVEFFNGFQIIHPDFDMLDKDEDPVNTGRILPLYPGGADLKSVGLDSRAFRKLIKTAFEKIGKIPDYFSDIVVKENALLELEKALRQIHLPDSNDELHSAIYRLKYDEHFFLQILMALRRKSVRELQGRIFDKRGAFVKELYRQIPFELTSAQINVLREIRKDLSSPSCMNRLLQGDVGSGKTIVALLTSAIVIGNGAQVALMAPTEILAEQHYKNFKQYCDKIKIVSAMLKGGMKKSERTEILTGLKTGKIQIIVGTHALIQSDIEFQDLGLVIVDEQHRFGVDQRKTLIEKGWNPDVLVMTATPIPRTLAITYHGDMDVSIIDELPKNRIPIKTKVTEPTNLENVYDFIRKEIKNGRQCFVVYPLIEESEKMDLKAAETGFQRFKEKIFKEFKVGYIHGKMKADERDEQMESFAKNEIQILVSTTVIEVGIDIPNASVMVIENAERFGLSQLHQLRGRIGRGEHQSYCVLVQRKHTQESDYRLNVMSRTINGFEISDEDLKLRGPGQFFGTRQHGYMKAKLADMVQDGAIIRQARHLAFQIIDSDSHLNQPEHKQIRNRFLREYKEMIPYINIG